MKILLLLYISIFFTGCLYFGDRGVSTHLYNDCKEYYDLCGNYHKDCPDNIIDYSEIKKLKRDILNPTKVCCEPEPCTR